MKHIHGDYSLDVKGDVLVIHARGPWNRACVDQYQRDYWAKLKEFRDSDYKELLLLEGESIVVPDALDLLRSGLPHSCRHGLKKIAVVLTDCKSRYLTCKQFEQIYQTSSVEYAFFDDQASACNWLSSQSTTQLPL